MFYCSRICSPGRDSQRHKLWVISQCFPELARNCNGEIFCNLVFLLLNPLPVLVHFGAALQDLKSKAHQPATSAKRRCSSPEKPDQPNFVGIPQIVQKILLNTENLKNIFAFLILHDKIIYYIVIFGAYLFNFQNAFLFFLLIFTEPTPPRGPRCVALRTGPLNFLRSFQNLVARLGRAEKGIQVVLIAELIMRLPSDGA